MTRNASAFDALYRSRPSHRWTNGDLAAKVGADLGLPPDEEQRWLLDTIFAERAAERPASFEVAVISPRQNIKTSTLGIAALADLFVFGVERHLWTAHHGDTLKGTFNDFRSWIKSNPEYDDQVTFYEGHQDMSIVHKDTGHVIDFQSRTGKAGRGLTGVKRITLDEALYLEPKHVGAVYPTMLTRPGAQVRIGSSAGLKESAQLRRIRDRGRLGKDGRLAYAEYGARWRPCVDRNCSHRFGVVEGCALDDRELWWQANCALWPGRILEESLADQRQSMPPDEFAREFLSWWEDPPSVGGAIGEADWLALADPTAPRSPSPVLGVDVDEARAAHIGVAWERSGGGVQVMCTQPDENRADVALSVPAATARLIELARKYEAPVVVGGAAADLADDLEQAGVRVIACSSAQFAAACGRVSDGVADGSLHHGGQAELTDSVRSAKWRSVGSAGERAWQLKNAPGIGPLAAVTRALHGLSVAGPSVYEDRGLVTL